MRSREEQTEVGKGQEEIGKEGKDEGRRRRERRRLFVEMKGEQDKTMEANNR